MDVRDLRTLAREYAAGVLKKDDYRKLRSKLFEDIISGEIEVESHDFLPPIGNSEGDATVETVLNYQTGDKETTKPKSTTAAKPPGPTPVYENLSTVVHQPVVIQSKLYKFLLYGGVLALVCLVALLALLITSIYKTSTTSVSVSSETTSAEPSAAETDTIPSPAVSNSITSDNLIQQFLSNNDWNNESMRQFLSDWYDLSYEEHSNALNSAAMIRLNQAIYQQFQEQNAMLVLGDNDAVIEKQLTLINFAEQLGIQDPRLVITDRR